MDPITALLAGFQNGMQGMGTAAASITPGGGADVLGDINPMSKLQSMLGGIKAPEATKPQFSGGVSGVGLPFLQSMPNLMTPALNGAFQRMGSVPGSPSLGALLAGGR